MTGDSEPPRGGSSEGEETAVPREEEAHNPPTQEDPLSQPPALVEDERIPDELLEIVEALREDDPQKAGVVLRFAMEATRWSGPLPTPTDLAAYNSAYDGCARDIVDMARRQQDHRIDIEKQSIRADIALRGRGQTFGFIIVLTTIVGGFVTLALGKQLYGFGALLAGLVSLAGLFLYRRHQQDVQLSERRSALSESVARARAEARQEPVTPELQEEE